MRVSVFNSSFFSNHACILGARDVLATNQILLEDIAEWEPTGKPGRLHSPPNNVEGVGGTLAQQARDGTEREPFGRMQLFFVARHVQLG